MDDDDLSYATEVGPDEIPGVDSDISEEGEDEDPLNPNGEVQQVIGGLQQNTEMEIIQEDDEVEETVDEDIVSEEARNPRTLSPQKPATRVSNLESVTSSPLTRSTPEQVEKARKNLENTATEFFCLKRVQVDTLPERGKL